MSNPNDFPDYVQAKWIRQSMQVSIEERPARPEDLQGLNIEVAGTTVKFSGDDWKLLCTNPGTWKQIYPAWQSAVDLYIMRRWVYLVTAIRECRGGSFTGTEIALELFFDELDSPTIYMAGGQMLINPQSGYKWLRQSINCNDTREGGKCVVTSTWRSYGEWAKVKIIKDPEPS